MSTKQTSTASAATDKAGQEAASVKGTSGRKRFVLFTVVPLAVLLAAAVFYLLGGRHVNTDNAYVKANLLAISADIDGRVEAVLIDNNQEVSAGDLLFKLDAEPLLLAVNEAQAAVAMAEAEIAVQRSRYLEANLSIDEAQERVVLSAIEFQRQKKLRQQGLGGGQEYDRARFALSAARQRVKVLEQRAVELLVNFGGDAAMPIQKHPVYMRAAAALDVAESRLARTTVTAPADGIVSNVQLQAGEYISAGEPVFSLIEDQSIWVEANYKETQLTNIRAGQSATLSVDAYPDESWTARITSIAPATGAEFTLLPPQNATGNWVKVVQRIPVSLQVLEQRHGRVLRAGMTVSVSVDTGKNHRIPAVLAGLMEGLFPQLAQAKAPHSASSTRLSPKASNVASDTALLARLMLPRKL